MLEDATLIARMVRYAISIFVIIIALGQISIGDRILYPAFLILLGGFVLAMAFGLGGQKWAGDRLEKFMRKKTLGVFRPEIFLSILRFFSALSVVNNRKIFF